MGVQVRVVATRLIYGSQVGVDDDDTAGVLVTPGTHGFALTLADHGSQVLWDRVLVQSLDGIGLEAMLQTEVCFDQDPGDVLDYVSERGATEEADDEVREPETAGYACVTGEELIDFAGYDFAGYLKPPPTVQKPDDVLVEFINHLTDEVDLLLDYLAASVTKFKRSRGDAN